MGYGLLRGKYVLAVNLCYVRLNIQTVAFKGLGFEGKKNLDRDRSGGFCGGARRCTEILFSRQ